MCVSRCQIVDSSRARVTPCSWLAAFADWPAWQQAAARALLNARGFNGRTPLTAAVYFRREDAVAWLLAHGADPDLTEGAQTVRPEVARGR